MTSEEVKVAAIGFVNEQIAKHEDRHGPSQFRHIFHEVLPPTDPFPRQWSVVFLITGLSGDPVDGPAIVLVDDESGDVRFLEAD